MRVTNVASACVVVEHRGVKVLCDPWLTESCYYGAWHHNPGLTVGPEDFHGVDYIYLSHIHQDHADLATLKRLDKRSTVLLAPYADDFLRQMVAGRGYRTLALGHGERLHLGPDFTVEIVAADACNAAVCSKWIGCPIRNPVPGVSYQLDSLAVFHGGGRTVVNVNDCPYPLARPALEAVKAKYGTIDFALTAYSGAGPWPQCFPQLSEAERDQAAAAKREQFIGWAHRTVETLGARYWLPFAGQYTLGGQLVGLNPYRGVPEVEELPDHPGMIRLDRGESWDVEREQASAPFHPRDLTEVERYTREVLSTRPLAWEAENSVIDRDLLHRAGKAWWDRLTHRGIDPGWEIHVGAGDHRLSLRFNCDNTRGRINVELDPRLLNWLLRRKAHWNAAEIGSQLAYWREPQVYDRTPYLALSYFHV